MLRISKFKLSEVQRTIKHGQLKPLDKKEDDDKKPVAFLRSVTRDKGYSNTRKNN